MQRISQENVRTTRETVVQSTKEFIDRLASFLRFALPQYVAEGKSYLTVAIGCTGGQHRSVFLVEQLAHRFGARWAALKRHRELDGA